MATDLRKTCHGTHHTGCDVARMRAGESNSGDPIDRAHPAQELGKIACAVVWRVVVIDDLPQELNLRMAGGRGLFDFSKDVDNRPHSLVPPSVGDHAKRTELVTALDNRHVSTDRIISASKTQGETDVFVRLDVDQGAGVLSPFRRQNQLRQLPQSLGAHNHIHEVGALGDAAALLLRDASGHGHDRVSLSQPRLVADLRQSVKELLLCLLTDRAGIDHDEIGIDFSVGADVASGLKEPRHALRVVDVHLAAECLD